MTSVTNLRYGSPGINVFYIKIVKLQHKISFQINSHHVFFKNIQLFGIRPRIRLDDLARSEIPGDDHVI